VDSNRFTAHYECAVSGCSGLLGIANPLYVSWFRCSDSPHAVPYCVRDGIRMVPTSDLDCRPTRLQPLPLRRAGTCVVVNYYKRSCPSICSPSLWPAKMRSPSSGKTRRISPSGYLDLSTSSARRKLSASTITLEEAPFSLTSKGARTKR